MSLFRLHEFVVQVQASEAGETVVDDIEAQVEKVEEQLVEVEEQATDATEAAEQAAAQLAEDGAAGDGAADLPRPPATGG